jgi:hypothetical protein
MRSILNAIDDLSLKNFNYKIFHFVILFLTIFNTLIILFFVYMFYITSFTKTIYETETFKRPSKIIYNEKEGLFYEYKIN